MAGSLFGRTDRTLREKNKMFRKHKHRKGEFMKSLLFAGLMCSAFTVFSGEMIISPQEWQFWGNAPKT